jgi:hypothetical protein
VSRRVRTALVVVLVAVVVVVLFTVVFPAVTELLQDPTLG